MARDPARAITTDDEFVAAVEQAAGISRDRAERAIAATLQTLAERIDAGEARQITEQLPDRIAPALATTAPAERFDADEFLRRVAEREGVDIERAQKDAEAVFLALALALTASGFEHLRSQLPRDFAPLLPRGPQVDVVPADAFLASVADRAGIGLDEARRASEAVLETLAMRISGGEVDDLRMRLPVAFHPALDRGKQLSGGKATRMRFDAFVDRIAELEGVSVGQAREHVAAVLRTLREAIGEREFLDVAAQLPDEYTAAGRALAGLL